MAPKWRILGRELAARTSHHQARFAGEASRVTSCY